MAIPDGSPATPWPGPGRGSGPRGALLASLCLAVGVGCVSNDGRSGPLAAAGYELAPRVAAGPVAGPADVMVTETAARRRALARRLGDPGLVFLRAASHDHDGRFFQSDDFWYLSGVEIPDVALALVVGEGGELLDEVLFLPPKDPRFERWEGPRLAPGAAAEGATGFARTLPLPAVGEDDAADPLAAWTTTLSELGARGSWYTLDDELLGPPGDLTPDPDGRLRRELSAQRLVKSEYELACLQASIDITGRAILQALAEVRPGAHEYTAQAAIEGTYLRLGSERIGFPSICAAGSNSVTLHYAANRKALHDGELLLMDVGAKYRYYCADISRTIPVNGRFTPRQREIYELVLAAQTAAAEAARPGMTIRDLHQVARGVLEEAGHAQHFYHSVGHWLGLDVHDVGGRVAIEVGAVFTLEPGVYLDDEDLGVRIEDDYLMTEQGAVKLSTLVPSDPDALEALMGALR